MANPHRHHSKRVPLNSGRPRKSYQISLWVFDKLLLKAHDLLRLIHPSWPVNEAENELWRMVSQEPPHGHRQDRPGH
jgi:hypothetical protein